jgi:hypothetical protein
MKFKLTALSFLLVCTLILTSCEKDFDQTKIEQFSKSGIVMSAKNEVPTNSSTATGILNVSYSRANRILYYDFTWTGLTGNATLMHIHGQAPAGYTTGVFQGFFGFPTTPSGSFKGSLLIDNITIKEENLLNGLYYVNIHTAANPGGEIKGQITFN